ncbi:MAG TPA: AAA family ATPase [Opitutaceae bacterium]|jgi:predicted nucleic acid-binding protein
MTNETSRQSWIEQNRAHLLGEFARLKDLLAGGSGEGKAPASEAMEAPPAVNWVAEYFQLTPFERDLVLLCAGVEMDPGLAAACADSQGAGKKAALTFGFAAAVLPAAHWSALAPPRPLRRFRLVEVEAGRGLGEASLRINERILHYLAGINFLDPRLQTMLRASPTADWIADSQREAASKAVQALRAVPEGMPVIHFCGDDEHGQEDAAEWAAREAGRQLFALDAESLPPVGRELDDFLLLWEREALLLPGALLFRCGRGGLSAGAKHLLEGLPGPLFIASREPVRLERLLVRFDLDKPGPSEQKRLWERALGPAAADCNGSLDRLAEQFRLSARTIHETGHRATADMAPASAAELWDACRSYSRPKLEDLAQRVVSGTEWEDLILPEPQIRTLRLLASQVRHRNKVYETWGFAAKGRRGLGVSALFSGESGTGKTMAAEVLARELGLDLFRIDLSAVVSKYIGETEKNLRRVFDAAEEGGVLLLFDEADALFGRRGEVKDSHDRYANIEVGYLLQRMEAYQGLAILTTNLKSTMDRSFQRRLRFNLNFPFPDASQREAIWKRIFPAPTPTKGLDARKLAQLNVTGGHIRNIALNAAFIAADAGGPVEMNHVFQAAKLEAQKIERPLSEAEVKGWL